MSNEREQWGSRIGFILAASGSAVGLGNIWKYPYTAGENGGGAFTLIYLVCILLVGLPIMLTEFSMGRKSQRSPVGAFIALGRDKNWAGVGFLGVASAFIILSFYSVVGGWTLKYAFLAITEGFGQFTESATAADEAFNNFTAQPLEPLFWHFLFMGGTIAIIVRGVQSGIEKASKILMPFLLVLLLMLVIRGLTLDGASEGLKFLFAPKWEDVDGNAIVQALGHSFFTLSLGMGTMITYGSYLNKEADLVKSALWVILIDTVIALLAGIAIFTAVFALGHDPAEGPGLIFVVLPTLFPQMAGGAFFGFMFFVLLFVAALTSAISILEVVTAYFVDEKKWGRKKATLTFGAVAAFTGVFASLSLGSMNILGPITDKTFFDFLADLSSDFMLPIGGFLMALFVFTNWGIPKLREELAEGGTLFRPSATVIKVFLSIATVVVGYIIAIQIKGLF